MNNWPDDLVTELAKTPTALCLLYELRPLVGVPIRFTMATKDLTVDATFFPVDQSFAPSTIENAISGANQNLEITVLLGETISYEEILNRRYIGAAVTVWVASWANPAAGKGVYLSGRVGGAKVSDNAASAVLTIVGNTGRATHDLTEVYSATCRADFCDMRCGLSIETFATNYSIASVIDSMSLTTNPDALQADGYFNLGTVVWSSGANNGQAQEVAVSYASGQVDLFYPPPFPMQVGDTLRLYRGCAKTLAACVAYGNRPNFRGEPFIPGDDATAVT